MSTKVSLIKGDGIGPEIVDATLDVLDAVGADIEWDEVEAGAGTHERIGTPLPDETLESISETQLALKGPLETPVGAGFRSVNVALRQHFDLYANVRPARTIPGVKSRYADTDLDITVVRENIEGAYSGIEHTIPPDNAAAESIILITKYGSERICRFAFEHARRHNRDKVTLAHKANILKETSGLFLDVGRRVSEDYPDIEFDDVIIDAMCMKLVMNPEQFDVVVSTNLFGDILSDLTAGLVGGLGMTPGANIGDDEAIYEAVHGTAPDIAGQNVANPTALMLAAANMLEDIDMEDKADRLRQGIFTILERGKPTTPDLGGSASTDEYTEALISEIKS